jgi:hypothetical protein
VEKFWRYSCRVAGARNYRENVNAPENFRYTLVKPGSAYCPLCGFALADYWHVRVDDQNQPIVSPEDASS